MSAQPLQFLLNFNLNQDVCLENFVVGENQELIFQLFSPDNKETYLWGESCVGKNAFINGF